jgi:hypothetical protein
VARTYVQAVAERARLLALGRKLQVRIIKNPVRGADANPYPQQGVNDYLLEIKDPRPTGTSAGGAALNEATSASMSGAITATRWHDEASRAVGPPRLEHKVATNGLIKGATSAGLGPFTAWTVYGAGEVREGGEIPNSAAQFT